MHDGEKYECRQRLGRGLFAGLDVSYQVSQQGLKAIFVRFQRARRPLSCTQGKPVQRPKRLRLPRVASTLGYGRMPSIPPT